MKTFKQFTEKMDIKSTDMGDVIKDFQSSDAPQFAGKSKKKRREMAIAAKMQAEGTIQPNGTDKIEVGCDDVVTKKKAEKEMKDQQNESWTFDTAAIAKQELADAKNKKHRKRGKVANLLRKLGMKEEVEYVYEANIQPTSAKSGSHVSNLSHPTTNSVTHHSSGKEIGLITKQSDGTYHAHPSSVKLSHHKSGTFDSKEKAHQFIRNAHAHAIKNGHLSDKWKKQSKLPQFSKEEVEQIEEENMSIKPKSLRQFVESLAKPAKEVNVDKVNAAGDAPHEEKWEAAKKPAVKKESFTAEELLVALKEGLWPGTPEHTARFGDKYKQQQGGGAGVKKGSRYGGSLQKPDKEDDNDADDKPAKKNK